MTTLLIWCKVWELALQTQYSHPQQSPSFTFQPGMFFKSHKWSHTVLVIKYTLINEISEALHGLNNVYFSRFANHCFSQYSVIQVFSARFPNVLWLLGILGSNLMSVSVPVPLLFNYIATPLFYFNFLKFIFNWKTITLWCCFGCIHPSEVTGFSLGKSFLTLQLWVSASKVFPSHSPYCA